MNSQQLVAAVVNNNAEWCDTVCRTHGGDTQMDDVLWTNSTPSPRFYPNAETLGGPELAADHRNRISELLNHNLPSKWGLKDSFGNLKLEQLGFTRLFDANWIACTQEQLFCPGASPSLTVERDSTEAQLMEWESAWNVEDSGERLILPALLRNKKIVVLGIQQNETIVAGAIAYCAAGVISISNVFVQPESPYNQRAELLLAAASALHGMPFVGYEHGPDLVEMQQLGFVAFGDLTDWLAPGCRCARHRLSTIYAMCWRHFVAIMFGASSMS